MLSPYIITFQGESIVTHAITYILLHNIFHILQCLGLKWNVEACPLIKRKKIYPRRIGLLTLTLTLQQ